MIRELLNFSQNKTFLIETEAVCFRVDLRRVDRGYKVARVFEAAPEPPAEKEEADAFPDLDESFGAPDDAYRADWVVPLLKMRPRPAPEVTVLSDKVGTLVAEFPGMVREELHDALELEAHTLLGFSAAEAQLASARLHAPEGMVKFRVTQAAMDVLLSLRRAVVRSSGSRLVAVGHPGGIGLTRGAAQLELWPRFALLQSTEQGRQEVRAWTGSDAHSEALADERVLDIFHQEGTVCLSGLAEAPRLPEGASPACDLRTAEGRQFWSEGLAAAVHPMEGNLPGLPCIVVPKPPTSTTALVGTAAAITVATVVLLAAHHIYSGNLKTRLEATFAELEAPVKKLRADQSRYSELQREHRRLLKEMGNRGDRSGDVNPFVQRMRLGALLDGLAQASGGEEAALVELRSEGSAVRLHGLATRFEAPQTMAENIDRALAENGWRASLVRRTAELLQANGGPWSFEILLSPDRPVRSGSEANLKTVAAGKRPPSP